MHAKPLGAAFDVIPGIVPVDLQTAQSGDYVSLKNAAGVVILVLKGAGTAGDDPTVTVRQAQDVAGTAVKDFDPTNDAAGITEYFKKQGAALTAVGAWTKVTQAAAATVVGDGTSAEEQLLLAIQIDAEELDIDNGFDCIAANIADVGNNAQLGTVLYLLYGLSYPSAPDKLPSAIVD